LPLPLPLPPRVDWARTRAPRLAEALGDSFGFASTLGKSIKLTEALEGETFLEVLLAIAGESKFFRGEGSGEFPNPKGDGFGDASEAPDLNDNFSVSGLKCGLLSRLLSVADVGIHYILKNTV
jgi:hypothetical protein